MRSEPDLDEAIDRAVRDIMSAEPRPGLRGRVLERLEHPRTAWFTVPRFAAAAAVLASVVLAVFLLTRPAPVEPTSVAETQPVLPAPPVVAPRQDPGSVPPPPDPKRTVKARVPPAFPAPGTVAAANVPETMAFAADVPDLPRIVVVDGIPAPAIVFDKITIQPIAMPPIVIDPIRPPR
jgi:hypothetical protein